MTRPRNKIWLILVLIVCSSLSVGAFIFWPSPPKDALDKALETKDPEQAIKYYTEYLAYPDIGKDGKLLAYWFRGYSYREIGNTKKEIADYTRGLVIDPNHTPMIIERAIANLKLGQCEKAEPDLQHLDYLRGAVHLVPIIRAEHYWCIGEIEKAIEVIDNAILIFPRTAQAQLYAVRGEFYEKNNNLKKALRDYQKSLQIGYTSKQLPKRIAHIRNLLEDK